MSARQHAISSRATKAAAHLALAFVMAIAASSMARGQNESQRGITKRVVLPAFDAHAPACSAPRNLTRSLVFVQENEREFLQGVDHGLKSAAKDRGLTYRRIVVDNDVGKAVFGIEELLPQQIGAVIATSSDPVLSRPACEKHFGRVSSSEPSYRLRRP